jgi:hypothetical protein
MSMDELRIRHWRLRAEELRVVAEGMSDNEVREQLLAGAAHYESMADRLDPERTVASGRIVRKRPVWKRSAPPPTSPRLHGTKSLKLVGFNKS